MFKRKLFVVVVASVMLLIIGITPLLANMPPATSSTSAGVTIPYSGRLNDDAGQPVVDGAYAFIFALYEAENGGLPVWTERQAGVMVQDGAFTVLLGSATALPREALGRGTRWLEVSVRAPDETEFTLLAPRQELAESSALPAAPQALSCAHTHLGEVWNGSAAWANGAFKVTNSQNGPSVWGVNTGGGNAVRGDGYGNSIGIYGEGAAGYGVFGRSATGFGLGAAGKDDSWADGVGDLLLDGVRGEIYAAGAMNLFSKAEIMLDLDDDNNDTNSCFRIYSGGNAIVGQTCENGTKSAVLQTKDYAQRAVYAVESPEVWLEEFGSATLLNGETKVTFEPIFAETVNLARDYHVFVTPLCQDPVLLFVTTKTDTDFVVKGVTLDNQPANCAFDYHVVAKRLGLEDLRLEPVSDKK